MKKIISIAIVAIIVGFATFSCKQKEETKQVELKAVVQPEWAYNAVIYEVNVRQYTKEGTFKAFEQYLPQLKELGVDVLWFMPVHPISELNKKGTLGSYYAVKDYKAVNPEFGTDADFKQLVENAHEMGFKVIIDWVANHTGCDNVWIADHSDWYVKDSLGQFVSPYDWTDTYKLDYNNDEMRAAMVDAMKYWVKDFNIDGYRCDVAAEVPTDFWNGARVALDSIKPVFMLAEAEKAELLEYAFNAEYGWELLHIMNSIAKKEKNVDDIYAYLAKNDSIIPADGYKMNFITNHDENSWNGTEYERYGKGVETFAVLTYTLNGMPLIYSGQEVGLKKRLQFFEKDPIPSWTKNSTFAFYKKLNELKHTHPALKAGKSGGEIKQFRHSAEKDLMIFSRAKEGKEILVMLNLSNKPVRYTVNLKIGTGGQYTDYFTGKKITELPTQLKAWEYKVYTK